MSKKKTGYAKGASFVVLALFGAALMWVWFFNGKAGLLAVSDPKPVYYEMDSVVVNVSRSGSMNRYFKVKPVLVVRNELSSKEVKQYSPIIRSRLIALFSRETVETLLAEDGFDGLRERSLQEVRRVVNSNDDVHLVSEVLFNEFVIQ